MLSREKLVPILCTEGYDVKSRNCLCSEIQGDIEVLRRKTLYVKPFWDQFGASERMKKQARWSNVFNWA